MLLGTAGHVDHGKTALVRALTGIDTDRLPEEKRRGITLELGFAHFTLPDGSRVGVVDVPGHERFVKAMASGAGGLDAVMLVVALDEGVMPQTRGHLDICQLLGVRSGVVVVTKSDLAEGLGAEWVGLVRTEISALVEGTFLEEAPVVLCSARTGEGMEALQATLADVFRGLEARPADGPLFLPVDQVFTRKGFGTVVTGTLVSGTVSVDDAVCLLPTRPTAHRIRGLQIHGQAATSAVAGQRVAVNVADVEPSQLSRGVVLARSGELAPTRMLDVRLTLLPSSLPLRRRQRLLLHLGTTQVEAVVGLLDADTLKPGQTALAQIRSGQSLAALPGQRFLLRGYRAVSNRGATLAGGTILSLLEKRRRKGAAAQLATLVDQGPERRVLWLLEQAGYSGMTERQLFGHSGLGARTLQKTISLLSTQRKLVCFDKETAAYAASAVLDALKARAVEHLTAFHREHPTQSALGRDALRSGLSPHPAPKLFSRVLSDLESAGVVQKIQDGIALAGQRPAWTQVQTDAGEGLVKALADAGLAPPRVDELAARFRLGLPEVTALLKARVGEGSVYKISEELYFSRGAVDALRTRVVDFLKSGGELTTQAFKEMVGQSRKFTIPLSEYFDREKVTLRVGEKRILRKG